MPRRHASIALLPFENLSGSPDGARIAIGFVQDLIAELARFPTIGVIAAHSAFAVESTGLDDAGIGRRLEVDYLLKGSVRRTGKAIRLNVLLISIASGQHVWAERYDVSDEELFAVEDEIAAKVANTLTARIDQALLLGTRRRQMTSLEAYECWLRGMESLQRGTLEADEEARAFFEQALNLDPHYARARAGLSLSHFNEWSCQAWDCWEAKEKLAYDCAKEAEALDPDDPLVQVILARVEQYRRNHQSAEARYRRALALAPNDATILIQLSGGFAYLGDASLAAELGERAVSLNPLCPSWYFYFAALPFFVMRDYARAVEIGLKTPVLVTDGPAYLAAAYARLGQTERAQFHLREFNKVFVERITGGRQPGPDEAFRWLVHVNPFRREEDIAHFTEGLRLAGMEGGAPEPEESSKPVTWPIANVFRRDGDMWTISFEHEVAHVRDARGLRDLAQLLGNPHEEVHCAVLAGQGPEVRVGVEILDETARRSYRARLRELDEELTEASDANDSGRLERLEEEKEQLLDTMRKATGLGGRDRKMGDGAERARTAVTWRIRHAIKKLEASHPMLAKHLRNSVNTGVFCSYTPERETQWFV